MSVPYPSVRCVLCRYVGAAAMILCAVWLNLCAYRGITTGRRPGPLVPAWHEQDFSYLENDHPPTLIPTFLHPRNVALVTEETVHYSPNASRDWESMFPSGSEGFVRLGPHKRLFGISMYHQLHCLRKLQLSTTHSLESDGKLGVEHLHHCLNYLRQTLLCAANVRLEPLRDDGSGVPKTDGMGLEHRCRDWTLVRHEVDANFEHWSWDDGIV